MNPILKNVVAVVVGLVAGGLLNMMIVTFGGAIVPPPEGMDPTDMESIKEYMPSFGPEQFIVPFLAHALGTLLGAFVAVKIAASHHRGIALGIGLFFLIGGVTAVAMLPSPMWFNVLDLAGAYLPMGLLGWVLARPRRG